MKCFPNPPYLCLCIQSSIRHPSEPVGAWRSVWKETCTNTLKRWAGIPGDGVYYPFLDTTNLLRATGHFSSSSLLAQRGINGVSVPWDNSVACRWQPDDAGTLGPCVRAHLRTQRTRALQGLWHWSGRAASWAKGMPSWGVRKHTTGRTNSQIHSWYPPVTVSDGSQS